jgi:hypothetical protein
MLNFRPLLREMSEIHDGSRYKEAGMKELERQRSLSRTSRAQRDTARAFGPKPVQPKPIRNCAELVPRAPGDRCHRD